ncbi:hypothetical protein ACFPA8_14775 [Streptomyces ovatisporus]|uniref:Secreted protein n=1 Tax=Streptomyces ovatisporus TaxID=1128682 RepID=A0ABV9A8Z0_9ACTN
MRKLREAAVVAAMVGSVSMVGAGIATAGGWEPEPEQLPTVTCTQDASETNADVIIGGTVDLLGGGGDADASATQQICGIGNEENENTAGEATGGAGTDAL